MKIKKFDRKDERVILSSMIVNDYVLSRIASKWMGGGLFKNNWSNLVGKWCVDYYKSYEKAPRADIEHIYTTWADSIDDDALVTLIEKFIAVVDVENEEHEVNPDYVLDLAGRYFNRVQVEKLKDTIETYLDLGNAEKAHEAIITFNQIELGGGEGIDVFQSKTVIQEAFEQQQKSIVQYSGDLGLFFGNSLARDSFIALVAPDKRGKSFWLHDIAFRASLQRRRVAFFEAGDNSRNQIMKRLMVRVARHPVYVKTVQIPVAMKKDNDQKVAMVKYKSKVFTTPLSWQVAWQACKKILKTKIRSRETYFKLSCHTNSSLHVNKIKSILDGWALDGWVPDVIVLDYADILDMTYPGVEGRDRINETWKQLRGVSQKYHCLLVTATQSDSAAYTAEVIRQENFSDDKRKNAHVTGMIGLNMNEQEKKKQITRLNWVVRREEEFEVARCVHVAGCKDIGDVAIKSIYP